MQTLIYIFAAIGFIQTTLSIASFLYATYIVSKKKATRKEESFIKIGEQLLDYLLHE